MTFANDTAARSPMAAPEKRDARLQSAERARVALARTLHHRAAPDSIAFPARSASTLRAAPVRSPSAPGARCEPWSGRVPPLDARFTVSPPLPRSIPNALPARLVGAPARTKPLVFVSLQLPITPSHPVFPRHVPSCRREPFSAEMRASRVIDRHPKSAENGPPLPDQHAAGNGKERGPVIPGVPAHARFTRPDGSPDASCRVELSSESRSCSRTVVIRFGRLRRP